MSSMWGHNLEIVIISKINHENRFRGLFSLTRLPDFNELGTNKNTRENVCASFWERLLFDVLFYCFEHVINGYISLAL